MTESDQADETDVILKRDCLGRVLTTRAQRMALLREFENSGLSGPDFARTAGINYQTLATWRQQQNRQQRASGAVPERSLEVVSFVEAVATPPVKDAMAGAALNLWLPQGARLEISHRSQIPLAVELLNALRKSC